MIVLFRLVASAAFLMFFLAADLCLCVVIGMANQPLSKLFGLTRGS